MNQSELPPKDDFKGVNPSNCFKRPKEQENEPLLNKCNDLIESDVLIIPNTSIDEVQKTKNKIGDIILIVGICVLLVLPLLLFTFVKPIRAIFRVIAEEFAAYGADAFINSVIFCAFGVLLLIFCISPLVYEMILAYCFQSFWKPFVVILIYRVIGISITHGLSKTLLHDKIMRFYYESQYFHALRYLARKRPLFTSFIIRFAHIPMFLANYGAPIFGYTIQQNLIMGLISSVFYVSIYISFGLSARSLEEIENMKVTGGPKWVQFLPLGASVLGVFVIIFLFFYAKSQIEYIVKKYEVEELRYRIDTRKFSQSGGPE